MAIDKISTLIVLACFLTGILGRKDSHNVNVENGVSMIVTNQLMNISVCQQCKKNNALVQIAHQDSSGAPYFESVALSLCEDCAKEFVRSAPERKEMLICAGWRTGEAPNMVTRRYQVVGILVPNRTRVKRICEPNKIELEGDFLVRTDLLPLSARANGVEFVINGTPLEIDIIENSVK